MTRINREMVQIFLAFFARDFPTIPFSSCRTQLYWGRNSDMKLFVHCVESAFVCFPSCRRL
ncbi:unnamed protein product [Prunus brigantina]